MRTKETTKYKITVAALTIATLAAVAISNSTKTKPNNTCIAMQELKRSGLQHAVEIEGKFKDFTEHTGRPPCKESH